MIDTTVRAPILLFAPANRRKSILTLRLRTSAESGSEGGLPIEDAYVVRSVYIKRRPVPALLLREVKVKRFANANPAIVANPRCFRAHQGRGEQVPRSLSIRTLGLFPEPGSLRRISRMAAMRHKQQLARDIAKTAQE